MIKRFQGRIDNYEIHINNEQINIVTAGHHVSLIYDASDIYPSFENTYDDDEHIITGIFRTRQVELHTLYSIGGDRSADLAASCGGHEDMAEIILKPIGSIYSYAHLVNVSVNLIKGLHYLGQGFIPEHTDASMHYCCLSYGGAEFSDSEYSYGDD